MSDYLVYAIWSVVFAIVSFVIEKIYRGEKQFDKCIFWNNLGKIFRILAIALIFAHYFS